MQTRWPLIVLAVTVGAVAVDLFIAPTTAFLRSASFVLGIVWLVGSLASAIGGIVVYRRSRAVGLVCIAAGILLFAFGLALPWITVAYRTA
jgi:hypothetical protein